MQFPSPLPGATEVPAGHAGKRPASILDRAVGRKVYHFDFIEFMIGLFKAPVAGTRKAWKWLDGTNPEMDDFLDQMRYHRPKSSD